MPDKSGIAPSLTTLPIKKKPTKTQLTSEYFCMSLSQLKHSSELRENLGVTDSSVHGHFSQVQMYEVMSVAATGDALLLLASGYDSRESALGYLQGNGFSELAEDTSEIVAQALDRRIPATGYINNYSLLDSSEPYSLDALELASTVSLGHATRLIDGVNNGTISLKLIKELGVVRLSKIPSKITAEALTAVTLGESPLTMDGFKDALSKIRYGPTMASDSLKLGLLYGDKATELSSTYTALQMHRHLMEHHPERSADSRWEIVKFAAELETEVRLWHHTFNRYTHEQVILFSEAGATPSEVLNKKITLEQAKAIRGGLPASISSGVL